MEEDYFYQQLGKTIQKWLWVESEMYSLYAAIMDGANQHSVSVTFHHIESFKSKIKLIDNCLALLLARDSDEWKKWRKLFRKADALNDTRNKLVHEPVITGMEVGKKFIAISPSYSNALVLVKRKTSHLGPVITSEYKPSQAKLLDKHKININHLIKIKKSFKDFSIELGEFRQNILPLIKVEALKRLCFTSLLGSRKKHFFENL
jgi:hypothetical protein